MRRREFGLGLCATGVAGSAWASNEGDGGEVALYAPVIIRLTPQISRYRIRGIVFSADGQTGTRFGLSRNFRQRIDSRVTIFGTTTPPLLQQVEDAEFLARVHVDNHVLFAQPHKAIAPELHTLDISDGRTAFSIGGLNRLRTREVSPIPALGSLPVVGSLFRTRGESGLKRNLIIMVTPIVIRSH